MAEEPASTGPERLREQAQPFAIVFLGILVGLAVGCASIGFHWLIDFFHRLALGSDAPPVEALAALSPMWIVLVPTIGGLLVGPIVYLWAAESRGSGVPEVMEAVQLRGGIIRRRVAGAKATASAITIGTGGSVGQEGPVIQIGSAIGSLVAQGLNLSREHRQTLVGCGAAAGIAATFNAPISGAFFALEVILGNFAIPALSPIVLASVVATTVSRGYFGNTPVFELPPFEMASWWELFPYLDLGILCGVVAVAFVRAIDLSESFFSRLPIPAVLRPMAGGAVLGGLFLLSPHLYGSGFASITAVLQDEMVWQGAAALLVLKILACAVTLGSGGSGGVFSPALFLGATLGYVFGELTGFLIPSAAGPPAAYALVGMGAFLSGTTHSPVASIMILFEMTNDYGIILPVMLTITVATLVARTLSADSAYTRKLSHRGISLYGARDDLVLSSFSVGDLMQKSVPTVPAGANLTTVLQCFLNARIDVLYVVDDEGRLLGEITLHDVKGVVGEDDSLRDLVVAADVISSVPEPVQTSDALSTCLQQFTASGRDMLPVVVRKDVPVPIGLISRHDLIDLYDREVLRREMVGSYSPSDESDAPSLPAGFRVGRIAIPERWIGMTLRSLEIRRRTGVTVVGIAHEGGRRNSDVADPDHALRAGDTLVVLGTLRAVAVLEQLTTVEIGSSPSAMVPPRGPGS